MLSEKEFREIRKLAKKYKVRIYWASNLERHPYGGAASRNKYGNIVLVLDSRLDRVLSVLFHEIGHVYCFRNKIWNSFHNYCDKKLFCLTALKAERWVDKWGEQEFKRYYPDKSYWKSSYSSKEDIKWFREYYNDMFNYKQT